MKIKVGIVGYGNLGKAVEEEILKNKNFKLVAIFSRRTISSQYNSLIEPYDVVFEYKNKIDVLLLCGSSSSDIEYQLPELSKTFCTINSFDTHSKLKSLTSDIAEINKKNNTISISACGWDPGLFSLIRGIMYAISTEKPITFWGKGVSMGHSDAIRQVDNVIDGVQFTVPNKKAVNLAKKNKLNQSEALHFRNCYVLAKQKDQKSIENEIKKIPNYFKGQPINVSFVDGVELAKLKCDLSHKGIIVSPFRLSKNKKAYMEFSAKMDSNPMFTAKIMTRYISAIMKLKQNKNYNAFLPIDIPISFLFTKKERLYFFEHLC